MAASIVLPILYKSIKNSGKEKERYNNMKEDIKNVQKINRDNAKRAAEPINAVRKQLLDGIED